MENRRSKFGYLYKRADTVKFAAEEPARYIQIINEDKERIVEPFREGKQQYEKAGTIGKDMETREDRQAWNYC